MSSAAGTDTATEPGQPGGKTGTFSALKVRNYRLFATGAVISNTGTWMSRIAQDWLVLSITGSSFAVGITTALQFLPMLLFGLYGGVIADRYPKRQILLCTQAALGVLGLTLAGLTLSGEVQVWHVYAIAFVLGMVTVVDNPTRQTFVVEMVGPSVMRNAVSLNAANFQAARLVGPAVAGVLITAVGSGWAFLINGLSFIAPLTGLLLMRTSELHKIERAPRGGKGQLREGLRYVAGKPELIWPIVLVGFIGTFGFNFPIWLSAFANKVFDSGAGTYGLLNSLMAGGSLIGALLAARRTRSRLRMLVAAALVFGLLEALASIAPSYWLFAALLVPIGIFGLTFNTTANATVQLATEPVMRGRVMSLYMMVFVGGTPIGGPVMGWVTDTYGARVGFLSGGLISAAAALGVGLVLARAGGLRVRLDLRRTTGRPLVAFVPREGTAQAAADGESRPDGEPAIRDDAEDRGGDTGATKSLTPTG
ncbi:Predicted arabinose efflux permease, MFS family [Streptomyces sp. DvalAA-14]|uniref:MFS transporter n=1 Tax=unclassified Streptomyces TaxID=2593676 RepID=UPI00081B8864|nr:MULTISPECIES: MFS transporter [unclassified Streptomyces]MYS19259.1 MFS transporter [Streptomyces sp. SID4948]SCD40513.1 Predicted arabinose efflux permease, MFS family [Streptomyces sp. DvalAA-14]